MQLFFLDESGTPPSPGKLRDRYFVVGGLVIPDGIWSRTRDALQGLKTRRGINGELKWRYFAPTNRDATNPMRDMEPATRNEIRAEMYPIICSARSIKAMACVASIAASYDLPHIQSCDDLYHFTYKPLSERFQYLLQDISRTVGRLETGIIVADHRGAQPDARFRSAHEGFLRPQRMYTSDYKNLVESLFFLPSDKSVGIQLADMVAGAVWRKYEKGDDFWYKHLEPALRKSDDGRVEGYGIIKHPRAGWR